MKRKNAISLSSKRNEQIQKALALHQSGKLDEAELQYKSLLNLLPNNTTLLTHLGIIALQKGNLEQGIKIIDRSLQIDPNQLDALNNYGMALHRLRRLTEALACFDKAIAINPNFAEAYANRGNVFHDLKRLNEAVASFDRAITIRPNFALAYINRSNALRDLNRPEEAVTSCDQAIAIYPNSVEAHANRGNALRDLNRMDEAIASFDRAIAINPNIAEIHSNKGNILRELRQLEAAVVNHDRAIAINPHYAEAYFNRGTALRDLMRLDEAVADYDRATAINPNYAETYWNKALLKLANAEYEVGWQLYEWRWKKADFPDRPRAYAQPLWLGEQALSDKTILIYPEQGLGDYIQFIRYALLVHPLAAKVILEVPKHLLTLISTLGGKFTLIEQGQPAPDFDYHCPVMSLPLAFKTTVTTIPAQIPYLYADKAKQAFWQCRLGSKSTLRVGLAWSGSTLHKNDHNRSMALQLFAPLFELPIDFHSLQKEIRVDDAAFMADSSKITVHQDLLQDFSDTAALIKEMDLVISVDTSIAHLAGALGKKVWVLLPYTADYRWMFTGDNTPWYPTASLIRQPAFADWQSVIDSITDDLKRMI